jgi:hypothetical protein
MCRQVRVKPPLKEETKATEVPPAMARSPRSCCCFPRRLGVFPRNSDGFPRAPDVFPRSPGGFPRPIIGFPRTSGSFPRTFFAFPRAIIPFPRPPDAFPRPIILFPRAIIGFPRTFGHFPRRFQASEQQIRHSPAECCAVDTRFRPSLAKIRHSGDAGTSREATTENSPQFQLRRPMPKTNQAPAGRQTDGERFGRPSGTGFYLACETRS